MPCLFNFCSSVAGSTESEIVLQFFCKKLFKLLGETMEPSGEQDFSAVFTQKLQEVSEKYPGFTIILDATNQFTDSDGKSLKWLPLPSEELNVRYVISCVPDYGNEYRQMKEKFGDVLEEIHLGGFDVACRKELVNSIFARYNKKLDGEQLELLISLDASESPLWISLACEELRIFGVFEQVTEHIKNLPGK